MYSTIKYYERKNILSRKNDCCDCEIMHVEMVEEALRSMPTEAYIADLTRFYKILGDETRLRICLALRNDELCVCDLANVLAMTKSAVSHQLRTLRENQIVKNRQAGKEVFYTLDDEHVRAVLEISYSHICHGE